MSRVIRDWTNEPGAEPETVLVLTRDEFRRALNLRSDEAVRRELLRLEGAGYLLSDGDRFERWVKRAPWDRRRDGKRRDRLLVFRDVSEPLALARVARGLRYDAIASGAEPSGARFRVIPC